MRFLVALYLLFTSTLVIGQGVTEQNPTQPVITLTTTSNFSLNVIAGAGTIESPHKVYIPVSTLTNEEYSYFSNRADLLEFSSGTASGTPKVNLQLVLDEDGVNDQVFTAFEKDDGNYEVSQAENISAEGSQTYPLDIKALCERTNAPCKTFDDSDTNTTNETFKVFVAVGTNAIVVGSDDADVDPTKFTTKVVYEFNMSNRINTNELILNNIFKGDGQLTADYTGSALVDPDSMYALLDTPVDGVCDSSEVSADRTLRLGDAGIGKSLSDLTDLESQTVTGQAKISNLENNKCYGVRLTFCDLYGFCTKVSNKYQGGPEDIQALLEKQACFFFTAGFGEEHPVVNYFQAFRDQHLRRFWLGRQFINLYYEVAPQYTPFILERPWLQSLIRGCAYILYGLLRAGLWTGLALFFVLAAIVQFRRKQRTI